MKSNAEPHLCSQWYLRGIIVWVLATIFSGYEMILRILPSMIVPQLMHSFHIHASQIGIIGSAYFISILVMQLVAGFMVDRFNIRWVFFAATLFCSVATLGFSFSPNYWCAFAARLVMGIGSSFAFVTSIYIVRNWIPGKYFAIFIGISGAVTALSMMGSNIAAPYLLAHFSWQEITFWFSIIGFVLSLLIIVIVKDFPQGVAPPASAIPIKQFFIDFLRTLFWPALWLLGLAVCLVMTPLPVYTGMWGIEFLKQARHFTAAQAGFANSLTFLGGAISTILFGILISFWKRKKLCFVLSNILVLIVFASVVYIVHIPVYLIMILLFIFGLLSGSSIIIITIIKEITPSHMMASAVAIVNMFTFLPGLLLVPAVGLILDATWNGKMLHKVRIYSVYSFEMGLSIVVLCLIIGIILSCFIRSKKA